MVNTLERARDVAATVTDPELPMLSLLDLGVLREVGFENGDEDGTVIVTITPTYSGCPAMATMRDDLERALGEAGFDAVRVKTSLHPAWSTDWISDSGRAALAEHGISPPSATRRTTGPVPLTLGLPGRAVTCPQCGSADTETTSEYGSTACKSLHRCRSCREPFDHMKEI